MAEARTLQRKYKPRFELRIQCWAQYKNTQSAIQKVLQVEVKRKNYEVIVTLW